MQPALKHRFPEGVNAPKFCGVNYYPGGSGAVLRNFVDQLASHAAIELSEQLKMKGLSSRSAEKLEFYRHHYPPGFPERAGALDRSIFTPGIEFPFKQRPRAHQ
jgi:hypothetical protein